MKMHIVRSLIGCLWVAAFAGMAQAEDEKTILLHSLDVANGIRGSMTRAEQIRVNTNSRFVSEGKASIRMTATTPNRKGNKYAGMRIPLAPTDLRDRTLILDCWTSTPEVTQALYVRLYTADGQRAGSWICWSSPFAKTPRLTVRLNLEMSRFGFNWEAKETDPSLADRIAVAEIIIGTRDSDAKMDVYVDHLRMTEARHLTFDKITQPKKLYLETSLVRAGKPTAVIVVPPGDQYRELGTALSNRIQTLTGVTLPVRKPDEMTPKTLAATNAILLGNVASNRAMIQLYALMYTCVDAEFPVEDGYLVHTVHDPWGSGHNAIIVGAASDAGLQRGVDEFLKLLAAAPSKPVVTAAQGELTLGKFTRFDLGKKENALAEQHQRTLTDAEIQRRVVQAKTRFETGAHRAVAGYMADCGFRYLRTGNEMWAKLYRDYAFAWYESYLPKPPIYGGPWGMDMDFHLMEILPAWNLLEESPVLSDEDRLKVTKILHEFITTDVIRKMGNVASSTHVRHNHLTFPALGLFLAGDYFQKGYQCIDAEFWLDTAEACMKYQMLSAKPYEDCNGYGWFVPYHVMRYAYGTLDFSYFANGNVRKQADYAILTMDNLGYQTPYGDTGSFECWWTEVPYLRGALYYHRDGRYAWVLDKKQAVRDRRSPWEFACQVAPEEPKELLGAQAIPLDKMYWETFKGPEAIPLEKAFDKVVMRASFDADRQFLLLDGLSNGGHKHLDGNSIPRITDRGRIWLSDNDYFASLTKYHNSVLVFRDGQASEIPAFCELEHVGDGMAFGASQTAVRNYTGTDWHRTILWNKERFFLVFDELVANEPAEYDFHCLWHTIGQATLTEAGLEVAQQGPRFFIKPASCRETSETAAALPLMKLSDNLTLGRNWNGYKFADPVVRSFREVYSTKLGRGQSATFANLLYASDENRSGDFRIGPVGDRCVLVEAKDGRLLAGVRPATPDKDVVAGIAVDAAAYLIGADRGFALGLRRLGWPGLSLASDLPIQLEWQGSALQVKASTPTNLLLTCRDAVRATGKAGTPVRDGQQWRIPLESGESTIQVSQSLGQDLGRLLASLPMPAPAKRATADAGKSTAQVLWTFEPKPAVKPGTKDKTPVKQTISTVAAGDLDGDGLDEVLSGSDGFRAWCLGRDGKEQWTFEAKGTVTTAVTARLGESGKPAERSAVFGSEDCNVYALSPAGALRWTFAMPRYKNPGRVRVLLAGDLDADGADEVVAGGDNWRYYAIDRSGKERWHYESVHPASAGALVDQDGDGKLETLCGTVYYWWPAADFRGEKRWNYTVKTPHATVALGANLEGTKTRSAVYGGEDGTIHVLNEKGQPQWVGSVGDEVTAILAVDLDGNGRDELVASTMSFNVFALDATGKTLWRRGLGDSVRALASADINGDGKPELLAGCDDGSLVVLDLQGKEQERFALGSAVLQLVPAQLEPEAKRQLLVRLSDGRLQALAW